MWEWRAVRNMWEKALTVTGSPWNISARITAEALRLPEIQLIKAEPRKIPRTAKGISVGGTFCYLQKTCFPIVVITGRLSIHLLLVLAGL